jgi:hypothetical protein
MHMLTHSNCDVHVLQFSSQDSFSDGRISVSLSKRTALPSALLGIPRFIVHYTSYNTETVGNDASIYLPMFSTSDLRLIKSFSKTLSNFQAISFRIKRAATPHQTGVSASVCAWEAMLVLRLCS